MTITERIKKVVAHTGMSMLEFERQAGLGRDRLSSQINRGNDRYSSEILVGICTVVEDLNPSWLLMGRGNMFMNAAEALTVETDKNAVTDENLYKQLYEDYKSMLTDKDERIKALEKLLEEKDKAYVNLVNMMTERLNQKDEHMEESSKDYQRTIRQLADRTTRAPFPYGTGNDSSGFGVAETDSKFKS